MSYQCPQEIFNEFYRNKNTKFSPSEQGMTFIYESIADGIEYLGMVHAHIPSLDEDILSDWSEFAYWVEDIGLNLEDLIDLDAQEIDEDDPRINPIEYFESEENIKKNAIRAIMNQNSYIGPGCIELHFENKTLYLIFTDLDAWGLGYGDDVLVVDNLDNLNEKSGFYDCVYD